MVLSMSILLLALFAITSVWCTSCDPANYQLYKYKEETCPAVPVLTTDTGAPVELQDTIALNTIDMLSNDFLMGLVPRALRERIPERVVHAKGAGAYGYFEVTRNVTGCCKASFLSHIGKRTPVFLRFSMTSEDKGEPDSVVDSRGMAMKMYTDEGIFDLVMFHTPMFTYKEPFMFQNIGKCIKRNPVTNLRDCNMLWDVITRQLECVNFFLYVFGENGIPCTYRHMPGFSCHTYQLYNKHGESCFCRFHMIPDSGIKNLCTEEALKLFVTDPDYAVRDLYNYIEKCKHDKNCEWPSWTVKLQCLTYEQVREAKIDPFDITKILYEKDYPLIECGKFYLNRNPTNYFADVEQAAFCPANVVPGILGAPDRTFASRRFAYKDTQRYRLGPDFNSIKVNRPHCPVNNYDRDGSGGCSDNGGSGPNFFQNTFHGPRPYVDKNRPRLINITQYNNDADNLQQATELYEALSCKSRDILAKNIVLFSLSKCCEEMQERAIALCTRVHPDLGRRLQMAVDDARAAAAAAAAAASEKGDVCSCTLG